LINNKLPGLATHKNSISDGVFNRQFSIKRKADSNYSGIHKIIRIELGKNSILDLVYQELEIMGEINKAVCFYLINKYLK